MKKISKNQFNLKQILCVILTNTYTKIPNINFLVFMMIYWFFALPSALITIPFMHFSPSNLHLQSYEIDFINDFIH